MSSPKPDGAASRGPSRQRRHDRFDWKTQVHVLWLEESGRGTSVTLRTQDLSAGGIALLSPSWVHLNRCGAILLADGADYRLVRWIKVVHGRYVPERKVHVVGCRWIAAPDHAPAVRIMETASDVRLEFETDLAPR